MDFDKLLAFSVAIFKIADRMKNETAIRFLHGESYRYYTLPYEKIESDTPASPGLYSWHIRIRPGFEKVTASFLGSVFQQQKLRAKVTGNLRLHYEGDLNKLGPYVSEQDVNEPLRDALLMIPMPLYVGISQNLRSRLKRHKECLNKTLNGHADAGISQAVVDSDTDAESNEFGARLGTFWRENKFIEPHSLFVNFLVPSWCNATSSCNCDRKCREETRRALISAESACNTLFNPVFGRK